MDLSEYEKRALAEIQTHKDRMVATQARRVVPDSVRGQTTAAGKAVRERASTVPGFDKAAARARGGYLQAVSGLGKAINTSSRLSLSEQRLLKAYGKRGHDVSDLAGIRSLDLRIVEKRGMPSYLPFLYASAAAVEGAASGLVVTGGQIVAEGGAIAGAGAGAAPGLGAITASVAVDTAAVLALCTRVVGHTAMYYGYDPREPAEAVFALGVVNLGTAVSGAGKFAAYSELSRITQLLTRNASWVAINKSVLPRVMNKFAAAFGVRLTKRKLGALIPVAGVAVGAGLNYLIVDQVADAAYWTYRERFLNEKRGISDLYVPAHVAGPEGDFGDQDAPIDLVSIVGEATGEVQELEAAKGIDTRSRRPKEDQS